MKRHMQLNNVLYFGTLRKQSTQRTNQEQVWRVEEWMVMLSKDRRHQVINAPMDIILEIHTTLQTSQEKDDYM